MAKQIFKILTPDEIATYPGLKVESAGLSLIGHDPDPDTPSVELVLMLTKAFSARVQTQQVVITIR